MKKHGKKVKNVYKWRFQSLRIFAGFSPIKNFCNLMQNPRKFCSYYFFLSLLLFLGFKTLFFTQLFTWLKTLVYYFRWLEYTGVNRAFWYYWNNISVQRISRTGIIAKYEWFCWQAVQDFHSQIVSVVNLVLEQYRDLFADEIVNGNREQSAEGMKQR